MPLLSKEAGRGASRTDKPRGAGETPRPKRPATSSSARGEPNAVVGLEVYVVSMVGIPLPPPF